MGPSLSACRLIKALEEGANSEVTTLAGHTTFSRHKEDRWRLGKDGPKTGNWANYAYCGGRGRGRRPRDLKSPGAAPKSSLGPVLLPEKDAQRHAHYPQNRFHESGKRAATSPQRAPFLGRLEVLATAWR